MKRPEEHTNRLWLRDGLYAQLKQLSAETGVSVAKLAEGFLREAIDGGRALVPAAAGRAAVADDDAAEGSRASARLSADTGLHTPPMNLFSRPVILLQLWAMPCAILLTCAA